jgi:hypothetical protein
MESRNVVIRSRTRRKGMIVFSSEPSMIPGKNINEKKLQIGRALAPLADA